MCEATLLITSHHSGQGEAALAPERAKKKTEQAEAAKRIEHAKQPAPGTPAPGSLNHLNVTL